MRTGRAYVQCGWDEVPHISEAERQRLRESTPAYQLKAREHGIPDLGEGIIYPIDIEEITVPPFEIPRHYWRAYGFDVGWHGTAALWGVWDRDMDVITFVHEYKESKKEPAVHASAIKGISEWQTGAIDPSAEGYGKAKDGEGIIKEYQDEGLYLVKAENTREAGILACYRRMTSGRLKLVSTLVKTMQEMRMYRRERSRSARPGDPPKVVKVNDHLMDCMRYAVMTHEAWMQEPEHARLPTHYHGSLGTPLGGQAGRSSRTPGPSHYAGSLGYRRR